MTAQSRDKILRFSRCTKCDLSQPGNDPTMEWMVQIKNARVFTPGLAGLGEIAKIEEGLLCSLCKEVTKKQVEMVWKI